MRVAYLYITELTHVRVRSENEGELIKTWALSYIVTQGVDKDEVALNCLPLLPLLSPLSVASIIAIPCQSVL